MFEYVDGRTFVRHVMPIGTIASETTMLRNPQKWHMALASNQREPHCLPVIWASGLPLICVPCFLTRMLMVVRNLHRPRLLGERWQSAMFNFTDLGSSKGLVQAFRTAMSSDTGVSQHLQRKGIATPKPVQLDIGVDGLDFNAPLKLHSMQPSSCCHPRLLQPILPMPAISLRPCPCPHCVDPNQVFYDRLFAGLRQLFWNVENCFCYSLKFEFVCQIQYPLVWPFPLSAFTRLIIT